jgi:hypothetical protein
MLITVGIALATTFAFAMPASAHEIVQLDASDQDPKKAPLAVDGTDPMGWFGVIPKKDEVRAFQVNLQAGQPLEVQVLIPDRAPEKNLPTSKLPRVRVIAPNGSTRVLSPNVRIPFLEQGRNLNLLIIREYSVTATQTGTYSFVVFSEAPARFLIGTGVEGEEFDGILRGTLASDAQIQAWYNTAP